MKVCKQCGNNFSNSKIIGKIRRYFHNRIKCLNCVPFNSSVMATRTKEKELERQRNKQKASYDRRRNQGLRNRVSMLRTTRKSTLVEMFGGKCVICGYNKSKWALTFHHIDPSIKKFSLNSRSLQYGWDTIVKEALKCILVYHNCHAEIHEGLVNKNIVDAIYACHRIQI